MSDIHSWVTTANGIDGFRVARNLGVVRGIALRNGSVFGNIGASLRSLADGSITVYSELSETSRQDAYQAMVMHALELGANGVIACRYDASEIAQGMTEMVCYGTAVVLEKVP